MNQKIAVAQAPSGPLTWIWYLCVLAVMTTLGSNMANAVMGPEGFWSFIGAMTGVASAAFIAWLWRNIHSLTARLILGALFLIVAAISALIAQALLESRDSYTAATPTTQEPAKPNVFDQFDNEPIDKSKVIWDQPAAQPQFSQAEIDRVNAAL